MPVPLGEMLADLFDGIDELAARARAIEERLDKMTQQIPEAQHLMSVPGIGLLTATSLVAFVGDIRRFPSCRSFADYLGLTRRERSSGHVRRLGRITKRGNAYLRMMLIHGARSALRAGMIVDEPDDLRAWVLELKNRRGFNLAAVALAKQIRPYRLEGLDRSAAFRASTRRPLTTPKPPRSRRRCIIHELR